MAERPAGCFTPARGLARETEAGRWLRAGRGRAARPGPLVGAAATGESASRSSGTYHSHNRESKSFVGPAAGVLASTRGNGPAKLRRQTPMRLSRYLSIPLASLVFAAAMAGVPFLAFLLGGN